MNKHDDFQGREYIYEYPPYSPQDLRRREGTLIAARLMTNAALTAPFAGGVSHVEAELVYGEDAQEQIAQKIEELAYTNKVWEEMFKYEAVMIRESDALIFLGSRMAADNALDAGCGMCGGKPDYSYFYDRKNSKYGLVDKTDRRAETVIKGPLCSARVNDLGFAVGSALWMATRLLVDARPFASIGMAGQKLGYCKNSGMVIGIPVATLSKNPYVDINPDYHLINMTKVLENSRKQYITPRTVTTFDYRKWIPKRQEEK
ncbi:MAG: DUF2148 domain-containing protein [Desulfitobacteriaceae bacterium]|nr:DUF2148 domain-containing protein [Desulfitobacteriaceae bacterium]MDI6915620.1 DUF2148 domain-containing protein [Desulfitobacteriaceae bacterium]